jgi:HSP20 family molecular chaperone IbpA
MYRLIEDFYDLETVFNNARKEVNSNASKLIKKVNDEISFRYRFRFLEEDYKYSLEINLPTFSKDELEINFNENKNALTLKSKVSEEDFWKKNFEKTFTFELPVDYKKIKSTLENGILSIEIPTKSNKESFSIDIN